MSNVVFAGDTSGSITIQAPAVAGTNILTLPTNTGTLRTENNPISGSVVQVVQATASTQDSTTSNSFVASSLSASITPKFATSKILIQVSSVCTNTGNGQGNYTIYRGATNLGGGGSGQASLQMYYNSSGYAFVPITMTYLDSPSTTSSTTYQVYFKTQSGSSTSYFGTSNITETITLIEVAA